MLIPGHECADVPSMPSPVRGRVLTTSWQPHLFPERRTGQVPRPGGRSPYSPHLLPNALPNVAPASGGVEPISAPSPMMMAFLSMLICSGITQW